MSIFTVEETKKIIMNTVQGMGEASEEQIQQVVDWCILHGTVRTGRQIERSIWRHGMVMVALQPTGSVGVP